MTEWKECPRCGQIVPGTITTAGWTPDPHNCAPVIRIADWEFSMARLTSNPDTEAPEHSEEGGDD